MRYLLTLLSLVALLLLGSTVSLPHGDDSWVIGGWGLNTATGANGCLRHDTVGAYESGGCKANSSSFGRMAHYAANVNQVRLVCYWADQVDGGGSDAMTLCANYHDPTGAIDDPTVATTACSNWTGADGLETISSWVSVPAVARNAPWILVSSNVVDVGSTFSARCILEAK